MKTIYYVTSKQQKVDSLQNRLNIDGTQLERIDFDFEEDHSLHVKEISKQKVIEAYRKYDLPVICLDAGFYIPALNKYPGSKVKDLMEKGNAWLLERMKKLKPQNRFCYWQHAISYMDELLDEPVVFCDRESGRIATEERGLDREWVWSNLAKLFVPIKTDRTLAELDRDEYYSLNRCDNNPYHVMFKEWYVQNRL